jgi:hypothetical protein
VSAKAGIRFLAFENLKTFMNTFDKNGSNGTYINLFAGLGAGLVEVLNTKYFFIYRILFYNFKN